MIHDFSLIIQQKTFWSVITRMDIWLADRETHGIELLLFGAGTGKERRVQKKTALLCGSTAFVGCNVA